MPWKTQHQDKLSIQALVDIRLSKIFRALTQYNHFYNPNKTPAPFIDMRVV